MPVPTIRELTRRFGAEAVHRAEESLGKKSIIEAIESAIQCAYLSGRHDALDTQYRKDYDARRKDG